MIIMSHNVQSQNIGNPKDIWIDNLLYEIKKKNKKKSDTCTEIHGIRLFNKSGIFQLFNKSGKLLIYKKK